MQEKDPTPADVTETASKAGNFVRAELERLAIETGEEVKYTPEVLNALEEQMRANVTAMLKKVS
jgi:hypothetical protein